MSIHCYECRQPERISRLERVRFQSEDPAGAAQRTNQDNGIMVAAQDGEGIFAVFVHRVCPERAPA